MYTMKAERRGSIYYYMWEKIVITKVMIFNVIDTISVLLFTSIPWPLYLYSDWLLLWRNCIHSLIAFCIEELFEIQWYYYSMCEMTIDIEKWHYCILRYWYINIEADLMTLYSEEVTIIDWLKNDWPVVYSEVLQRIMIPDIITTNGMVLFWNQYCHQILFYSSSETWFDIVMPIHSDVFSSI